MTPKAIYSVIGAVAVVVASLFVFQAYKSHRGLANQIKAQEFKGEADVHVNQAQAAPDHARQLQSAQADVARARAEVARVNQLLAAYRSHAVPDPVGAGAAVPPAVDPDPRDSVIEAQGVLIGKLDGQVGELTLALADKTKESNEWHAAFDVERKRAMAQEAATAAWKDAVAASKWRGRIEGFAVGVASGYVAGRLR